MEPSRPAASTIESPTSAAPRSIADVVLKWAAEQPDAVAVEDGDRHLTYAELDAASAAVAAGLRAAGCGAEEPVGVCLPRSWRAVCAFLGAVRAGAAYVPISAEQPPRRKRELLDLAGARLVLTDTGADLGLPAEARLLDVAELAGAEAEDGGEVAAGGERLVYVLFTSGSTGTPKGVEITDANILQLLGCGTDLLPAPGDTVLGVAPVEFDIAALETWGALAVGARLVLAPPGRPDPRALGRLIADRGVSFAFFAAGLFEQVVRAALPDLGGLRLVAAGGDVMSPAAAGAVRAAHPGVRVLNGYGPTETSIVASSFEVDTVDGTPLPIGRPLPGYRFHVLDENRRPVAPGESGELWIGGEGVARGYRGDPQLSAERFRPDPFAAEPGARMYGSGDLVRAREDGELLFLGRSDHQVKISGHRVEPGEVEQVLGAHFGVAQAAVVAREDVSGHKRLVAYVALREGTASGPEQLLGHLAERLPRYMLPATIVPMAELPLTARGKIDRAALPAPGRSLAAGEAGGRVAAVAELLAELLGLEEVGPDEDFFALGADSLLAIQLVGRLRDRFGAAIEVGAAFATPTARGLAAQLDDAAANSRPPLRRYDAAGPAPATFAQRRAWLFEQMNPGSLAFQFAAILHFEGELDEAALRGALGDLVARHEILRTALRERRGEPVQIVADEVPLPLEVIDLPGESGVEWARLVRSRARTRIRLDQAPLVRWTLVRRGPRRWSLIDVEHHAAHDGWSFITVLAELAELYSARVENRPAELAPLTVSLGDFARWERELASGETERLQLDYWRRNLNREPALMELPSDRRRPERESFAGGSVRRRVPAEIATAVRALARAEGATAYMTGLAAFAALLGRSSALEDLQIGTGLANRRDPAAEPLVGMTVGTVALRIDLSGDPTVRELLRRVRGTVLDAIANADVPYERVVEALAPTRQTSRSPLVQTLFSFDDAAATRTRWSGVEMEVVQTVPNGTAKADINVIGVDHGEGEPFYIWEHSDLLSDADADRLAGQHLELLRQFAASPDVRLSELDPLTAGERAQLREWSSSSAGFDREATIPGLVAAQARRAPDATAVIAGSERLSYAELVAGAARIGAALAANGVRPGDAVGVLAPRSAGLVAAQLGVLWAGAAYVPLDPLHPAARSGQALADAGARVVLADPTLGAELPPGITRLGLDAAGEEPLESPLATAEGLAYVIYTSGSTGKPKGVEVTHRNVAHLVDDPEFADLGPETTMLNAASPAFDASTLEIWGPLANGGTIAVLAEQPSPDAVAAAIGAHGVTTAWLTAGLFHELVDHRPDCLANLRQLLAGGDVLSPRHVARALAALPAGARLTNGYGPTETTTFALTHDLRPGDAVGSTVPLGRPIQATVCEVLDPSGRPVPVGVAGELWIGGEGVARGYRGDPQLSAERFRPDPGRPGARRYRSGDRVRRRGDGTIEFLGRLDRQVKVRGVRVEPAEVESVLRDHPALADAAVVAAERHPSGPALLAYVVAEPGKAAPTPAELRAHAAANLPTAMVPAAWVTLERLPLNASGKVDHGRLPTPGREHLASSAGAGSEPRDEAERRVVAIFQTVLGLDSVGADEDFFALGGHSLLAVALFAELERAGGRRLPLGTIFEAPTPRALAARLGPAAPAPRWDNLVALKPSGGRPPLFAITAGDGNVVGFGPLARALPEEQPLYALQPSGLDGQSTIDRGIEPMAARFIEEIRSVQPRGPYLLAGRCNGSTVAIEIAQQLRRAGEEVALLAALDSDPPRSGPKELRPGVAADPFPELARLRALRRGEEEVPEAEDGAALIGWLRGEAGPGVSRYVHEAWFWREDLQRRWPNPLGADAPALATWAWDNGIAEHELVPQLLLPAPARRCRTPEGHRWDRVLAQAWSDAGRSPEDPLSAAGWRQLREWLTEPLGDGTANRYLLAAIRRPDLDAAFPDPLGADRGRLAGWAWTEGIGQGLAPDLLPAAIGPLPRRVRLGLALRPAQRRARQLTERLPDQPRERLRATRARLLDAAERRARRPLPGARERLEARIVVAARAARDEYRAQPWPGTVVLIDSAEFEHKSSRLAWPERAARIERHQLPLGHVEMLREPGAGQLAQCLDECISQALQT